MKPITISRDEALQKVVKFHDLNDGRFAVDTIYDIQGIVDDAQRISNSQPEGWKADQHLVAKIPMPIYQALLNEWKRLGFGYAERQAALHAWLNDPDHSRFRAKRGKL